LGFQLSHIAGSLDRLTAYLESRGLTEAQLAYLKSEQTQGACLAELLRGAEMALQHTEDTVRKIAPATLSEPRYVGRQRIRTTVIGLAIHIAEHTQRHCGQAITTSKLLNAATYDLPFPPPA
jgi:hypothetical protein